MSDLIQIYKPQGTPISSPKIIKNLIGSSDWLEDLVAPQEANAVLVGDELRVEAHEFSGRIYDKYYPVQFYKIEVQSSSQKPVQNS